MTPAIEILEEPKDDAYKNLLSFALVQCSTFSLVWRNQFKFAASAKEIEEALNSEYVSSQTTSEWPGTKLMGHRAVVKYYRLTPRSIDILASVKGLYSWLQPHLPEDLAMYDAADKCWLATVSHERQAWILDTRLSLSDVLANVNGIKAKIGEYW